MEKFEGEVMLLNDYMFGSNYGWPPTVMHIYKFKDVNHKIYIWKTSNTLEEEVTNGSIIKISGSIKGENNYKGEDQIVLTRVKFINMVKPAPTKEERDKLKAEEQIASLDTGDLIWDMPYRQFKEHYSDCETLAGSYNDKNYPAMIGVIIRNGRLKKSGVRGEHYSGYRFINEKGEHVIYRAVSIENAEKRINKEFPRHTWTLDKIYNYTTGFYG